MGSEKEILVVEIYNEKRDLEQPLGASHMGLIYVNPQGPDANPDPKLAAHDIRETFGRMAMNDYETAALVAGGHTFGKSHGAAPESHKGPDPEASRIQDQSTGWNSGYKSGKGVDTISSGIEGAWTQNPIQWDMGYLDCLYDHEWELTKSPAGAHQWTPKKNGQKIKMVPDAHDKNVLHPPMMQTTDISMKVDPSYGPITKHFHKNPKEFHDAFARAWFKLTHRDMGPILNYLGSEVPKEDLIWQDPIPKNKYKLKKSRCTVDVREFEMKWYWQVKRFWEQVDIKGDDECWKWQGATRKNGTESTAYFPSPFHSGKTQSAPRIAFWLSRGYTGKYRIFNKPTCTPFCCNPKHLMLKGVRDIPECKSIKDIKLHHENILLVLNQ